MADPTSSQQDADPTWVDPEERAKQANEAWLREHYKIVAPLLILFILAIFVLPLLFFSFLEALVIQIAGAGLLYLLGRRFTTAFDHKRPF
jgi:uncharacterized membrane protein